VLPALTTVAGVAIVSNMEMARLLLDERRDIFMADVANWRT